MRRGLNSQRIFGRWRCKAHSRSAKGLEAFNIELDEINPIAIKQ
jgi:hypothetical protein